MKNIFEKLDKMFKKMRQIEKIKGKNRFDILHELIRMTQGREIVLVLKNPRTRLKITQKGVFLWKEGKYMWDQMINFASCNESDIKGLANDTGSVGSILKRVLEEEVEIEIT